MKRLIRKIVNWAYGEDIALHLFLLEKRHENTLVKLYDTMLAKAFEDAGINPGDIIHSEEVEIWPATTEPETKEDDK